MKVFGNSISSLYNQSKRFFIRTFLWMGIGACIPLNLQAQQKRALVVGISDYESAGDLNVWPNIHGTNDACMMEESLRNQGFQKMTVLLDKEATFQRILNEFELLEQQTQLGDTVLFHFSGHGQPFEDVDGDEGADDGWDESIVPYDAGRYFEKGVYEGQHHITDDRLYGLLDKVRRKAGPKGMVYAIIDACFSGSAMRGDEDGSRKSTVVGFCVNGYKEFSPKVVRNSFRLLQSSVHCADLIALESSLPYRRTREIKVGNEFYGPLTFYTVQSWKTFPLREWSVWIPKIKEYYRQDRRLHRETIFCESTLQFDF